MQSRRRPRTCLWMHPLEQAAAIGGWLIWPRTPDVCTKRPRTLKVTYMFAGPSRKADVREHLHAGCIAARLALVMEEIDICRGDDHDLLDPSPRSSMFGQPYRQNGLLVRSCRQTNELLSTVSNEKPIFEQDDKKVGFSLGTVEKSCHRTLKIRCVFDPRVKNTSSF